MGGGGSKDIPGPRSGSGTTFDLILILLQYADTFKGFPTAPHAPLSFCQPRKLSADAQKKSGNPTKPGIWTSILGDTYVHCIKCSKKENPRDVRVSAEHQTLGPWTLLAALLRLSFGLRFLLCDLSADGLQFFMVGRSNGREIQCTELGQPHHDQWSVVCGNIQVGVGADVCTLPYPLMLHYMCAIWLFTLLRFLKAVPHTTRRALLHQTRIDEWLRWCGRCGGTNRTGSGTPPPLPPPR